MMSKSLHLVDRAITCRVGAGAQRVPPGGEREVDRQCDVGSADSAPPARDKRHREHQRAAVHAGFENLCHDLVYDGATEPHGYTIYPCPSKAKSRGAPPATSSSRPHTQHRGNRGSSRVVSWQSLRAPSHEGTRGKGRARERVEMAVPGMSANPVPPGLAAAGAPAGSALAPSSSKRGRLTQTPCLGKGQSHVPRCRIGINNQPEGGWMQGCGRGGGIAHQNQTGGVRRRGRSGGGVRRSPLKRFCCSGSRCVGVASPGVVQRVHPGVRPASTPHNPPSVGCGVSTQNEECLSVVK